jgi:hypothetical protein
VHGAGPGGPVQLSSSGRPAQVLDRKGTGFAAEPERGLDGEPACWNHSGASIGWVGGLAAALSTNPRTHQPAYAGPAGAGRGQGPGGRASGRRLEPTLAGE